MDIKEVNAIWWFKCSSDKSTTCCDAEENGKYLTKTEHSDGSLTVNVYPSYPYFERYILGENKGARIKTYEFNR